MADEAVLRIRLDGGRRPGPGGAGGPAPGAAPQPAGRFVGPPPARDTDRGDGVRRGKMQETTGALDVIATIAIAAKLKLGGAFGALIDAVGQSTAAWQDMTRRSAAANAPLVPALPPTPLPSPVTPEILGPPEAQAALSLPGFGKPAKNRAPAEGAIRAGLEFERPAPVQGTFAAGMPDQAGSPIPATRYPRPPLPTREPHKFVETPGLDEAIAKRQGTQYAPQTLGAIASAAAGPLAIVGAVIAGMVGVKAAALAAVDGLGKFAAGIASPDANPAQALEAFGSAVTENTGWLVYIGNALGILGPIVGHTSESFGRLMRNLDALSQRYDQYEVNLARAVAVSEARQQLGDVRRAQQIGPELGRYIDAQSRMQQTYEDLKIRLLEQILPTVTDAVKVADGILTIIKDINTVVPIVKLALDANPIIQILHLLARWLPQQEEELEALPNPLEVALEARGIRAP